MMRNGNYQGLCIQTPAVWTAVYTSVFTPTQNWDASLICITHLATQPVHTTANLSQPHYNQYNYCHYHTQSSLLCIYVRVGLSSLPSFGSLGSPLCSWTTRRSVTSLDLLLRHSTLSNMCKLCLNCYCIAHVVFIE